MHLKETVFIVTTLEIALYQHFCKGLHYKKIRLKIRRRNVVFCRKVFVFNIVYHHQCTRLHR